MKKLLLIASLFATPALAEPVMPGPNATAEERLAYIRALRIESEQKHKQIVEESNQRLREFNVKMGFPPDYVASGYYRRCSGVCTTTVYHNGRVYRFTIFR